MRIRIILEFEIYCVINLGDISAQLVFEYLLKSMPYIKYIYQQYEGI